MYVDTSILAKFFVRESDSDEWVERASGSFLASSEIVYAEMLSALLRKEQTGIISSKEREKSWSEFERQVHARDIHLIPLDRIIMQSAKRVMLDVYPHVLLRTLDAIHLATYLSTIAGPLYTDDRRMRDAALFLEIPLVA